MKYSLMIMSTAELIIRDGVECLFKSMYEIIARFTTPVMVTMLNMPADEEKGRPYAVRRKLGHGHDPCLEAIQVVDPNDVTQPL